FLDVIVGIAADVANRDARALRFSTHHLDQVTARFLGQRRQVQADHGARRRRVQAEIRCQDRFLDQRDQALVEGIDHQRTAFLDTDIGKLLELRIGAVIVDRNGIQQAGMGTTGAHFLERGFQRFKAFLHAPLGVLFNIVNHLAFPFVAVQADSTSVPSLSPSIRLSRAPFLFMLKTRSGMLWSRHRQMAVRSMTPSLRSRTSSNVRRSYLTAFGFLTGSSSNTPSTLVALSTTSALISIPRRQAAESVVKNGLPVPAEKITTSPFLRLRIALR